ncbi:MAG TPA: hypothetical protein DCS09_09795 [Porphyromonadaceae bacterium]|nr:hypothetical protein [Porphyromonadaceae bacterium]
MTETAMGVYAILQINTDKRYIGSSINISNRMINHIRALDHSDHHNSKLQAAWEEAHGLGFEFYEIEEVFERKALLEREQFWIDFFDSSKTGFNIMEKAGGVPEFVAGRKNNPRKKKRKSKQQLLNKPKLTEDDKNVLEHIEKERVKAEKRAFLQICRIKRIPKSEAAAMVGALTF